MHLLIYLVQVYAISFLATLNTRKVVRGRGTDKQQPTLSQNINSHTNTNTFYLGTRIPSVGTVDLGEHDFSVKFMPPPECMSPSYQRESRIGYAV
jgi:hypothetical protein